VIEAGWKSNEAGSLAIKGIPTVPHLVKTRLRDCVEDGGGRRIIGNEWDKAFRKGLCEGLITLAEALVGLKVPSVTSCQYRTLSSPAASSAIPSIRR
jgi:hypothetical protein